MIVLCTNAQNYVYQNVYSIILLPTFFRELQSMPKVLGISHQSKNCFESTSRLYKLPKVCSRIPERKLISSLERKVSSSHYSRVRSGYKVGLKIIHTRKSKQLIEYICALRIVLQKYVMPISYLSLSICILNTYFFLAANNF